LLTPTKNKKHYIASLLKLKITNQSKMSLMPKTRIKRFKSKQAEQSFQLASKSKEDDKDDQIHKRAKSFEPSLISKAKKGHGDSTHLPGQKEDLEELNISLNFHNSSLTTDSSKPKENNRKERMTKALKNDLFPTNSKKQSKFIAKNNPDKKFHTLFSKHIINSRVFEHKTTNKPKITGVFFL
jgi:hypothetical protein